MDRATAQQMTALTCDFYRRVGPSFSATRAGAWPGWERMLDLIATCGDAPRVLDLACGNLRFERALFGRMPAACAWAVDSCDEMACGDDPRISF
ncbi:MAG: class I SAM-dependent methyltransferase, partial [Atopobiaceae bacterium]|nr:class I SAM-dependent methyltransferase [Atopobiaceae bacterium]